MDTKQLIRSFAHMIRHPDSREFSKRKKVLAWALSIIFYIPPLTFVHLACWRWEAKHAPAASPKVSEKAQEIFPPAPAPLPPVQPPTRKMIDMIDLRTPEKGLELAQSAAGTDTSYFFNSVVIAEDLKKSFHDYLDTSQDKNLTRKGAYLLIPKETRYDHNFYYHYLIKALQDQGQDVYFVVLLPKTPHDPSHEERPLSPDIEAESKDIWHPYYLKRVEHPDTNWATGPILPEIIRAMPSEYPLNQHFEKIPQILGWSRHVTTF